MQLYPSAPKNFPWVHVEHAAKKHKLDRIMVAAICIAESRGNTNAYRAEFKSVLGVLTSIWRYHLDCKEWADRVGSSTISEYIGQATSWGLMQVMGTVAREYHFSGWLTELCKPSVGLEYGCTHLKAKIDRYGSVEAGIAAYNAGNVRKNPDGTYVNQKYVSRVISIWKQLKREQEQIDEKRRTELNTRQKNTDKRSCDRIL